MPVGVDARPLVVGIDASNIRIGGTLTALSKMLEAASPDRHGISRVVAWGGRATLERLPVRNWLEPLHDALLDRSLPYRLFWERCRLPALASRICDVLFVPGGNAPPGFAPVVAMSQNMLPFELSELRRYGFSLATLRLLLLRYGQAGTFHRADGLIFLTEYAQAEVMRRTAVPRRTVIVPHGVDDLMRAKPRPQRSVSDCSESNPFRLLYVSTVDLYKHQWHVAEAVARLRYEGLPIVIDFVGPAYRPALRRLRRTIRRLDPAKRFLRYEGPVPFEELHAVYHSADAFVFASSCENMPNILLEAMASGLPIACARRGPMPDMLGDAGVYFDPEDAHDIAASIRQLICALELRTRLAKSAFERAAGYSWERCAREALEFISRVAREAGRRA